MQLVNLHELEIELYKIVDNEKNKAIGIDIHGVITRFPSFFAIVSFRLIQKGHQVHIITGAKCTPERCKRLKDLGINWTHFFSIVDYCESNGKDVRYDEKNQPWIDEELWNKAKANYCEQNGIYCHIDDSDIYGQFFKTTKYLLLK
jgi:hypothetical protein